MLFCREQRGLSPQSWVPPAREHPKNLLCGTVYKLNGKHPQHQKAFCCSRNCPGNKLFLSCSCIINWLKFRTDEGGNTAFYLSMTDNKANLVLPPRTTIQLEIFRTTSTLQNPKSVSVGCIRALPRGYIPPVRGGTSARN